MIQRKWLVGPLALALSAGVTGVAVAQTPGQPGAGGNQGGGGRGNFQNMTPEQRAQMQAQMQQQREQNMRQQLTAMGFTDEATQTAIIAFANSEAAATQPPGRMGGQAADQTADQTAGETPMQAVRRTGRALTQALRTQGVTNDALRTLLNEFNQAVEAEKKRRAGAIAALRTQLKLDDAANARLDAFLTINGTISDIPSGIAGGGGRGGRGGMGALGGGGGGFGGAGAGGGGRGGRGGGAGGGQ